MPDPRYLDLVTQKTATTADAEPGSGYGLCQISIINLRDGLSGYPSIGSDCAGYGEVEYRVNEIKTDLDAILRKAKIYYDR